PFTPTNAQARALREIAEDLAAERPMNRLVQGDVGSGKTAVALVSAALVVAQGRQASLLAPTEILAEQHFASAQKILAPAGLMIARLTGSAKPKERQQLLRALESGQVDVLVGTHALLEPDVVFRDLGLAIVDEQHRFGVHQRASLRHKRTDVMPDLLLMTATPIPRTLTLTAYGDLHVSIIDELPPGRQPTVTEVFQGHESDAALEHVADALAQGRQAYVVYPLVEASEKLDLTAATDAAVDLRARFEPHPVALLHGRMTPDEKASVMNRFKAGEIGVLVCTTVIEVGVDVPNATVMLVEHAERFGLSQLHQLRGRVGRGQHAGSCLLVAHDASRDGRARLSVLAETSDGFVVAERDLAIRGPGEVLGTRQSGLPDLIVTNLARDGQVLEQAKAAAEKIVTEDPTLSKPEHRVLVEELERRFKDRLALTTAG
ncbi:MAG: ATP-dependent DNA helicase RecG, partial [Myxococcota bacterium]